MTNQNAIVTGCGCGSKTCPKCYEQLPGMTPTPDDRDRAEAAQVEAQLWAARSEVQRMTILSHALAAARRDERQRCAGICDEARKAALRTQHASMSPELAQRAATEADAAKQLAAAIRQPGMEES